VQSVKVFIMPVLFFVVYQCSPFKIFLKKFDFFTLSLLILRDILSLQY